MATKELGPLVIIGGAEDHDGSCQVLREFVRLAGDGAARIVVVTTATEHPQAIGRLYEEVFARLIDSPNARDVVSVLHIEDRKQANKADVVAAFETATGVFFTGGDQLRITRILGGTRIDSLLHEMSERGVVLGGTSAGAAMMSGTMIVRGTGDVSPRPGTVELGPGLEFLSGVMIDQHFTQRGRLGRLLSALAQYPHLVGLGIDEDTAVVVTNHRFTVVGSGAALVVDAGRVSCNNIAEISENDHLALCGVKLHVLPDGYGYDLLNRMPIYSKGREAQLKDETQ